MVMTHKKRRPVGHRLGLARLAGPGLAARPAFCHGTKLPLSGPAVYDAERHKMNKMATRPNRDH